MLSVSFCFKEIHLCIDRVLIKIFLAFFVIFICVEGPATTMVNGKLTLVGLTSFSMIDADGKTCKSHIPAAYARISDQLKWIRDNTDVAEVECGKE